MYVVVGLLEHGHLLIYGHLMYYNVNQSISEFFHYFAAEQERVFVEARATAADAAAAATEPSLPEPEVEDPGCEYPEAQAAMLLIQDPTLNAAAATAEPNDATAAEVIEHPMGSRSIGRGRGRSHGMMAHYEVASAPG